MKLTKKAAALLLAASLAVSVCAMPVFATGAGTTPTKGSNVVNSSTTTTGVLFGTGQTKVVYKVTESYTWTVPATIDFGENAGVNQKPKVTTNVEQNENLTETGMAASSTNSWAGTAPKIMVTKNVIGVGKNLQITVDTDHTDTNGKFYVETPKMTTAGPSKTEFEKLYYTITKPDTAGGNGKVLTGTEKEVLRVPSGTNTSEQVLVFTLETTSKAAEQAGDYEGLVAFHSQLVY